MIVRPAGIDDMEALIAMGFTFYLDGKLPGTFDPQRFVNFWTHAIWSKSGAVFVLEDNGNQAGTIGALIYQDPNDGALVSQELFWWVNKDWRGGSGPRRLFRAFEEWSKVMGAKRIVVSTITGMREEALGRFYGRLGYRPLETNYIKEA